MSSILSLFDHPPIYVWPLFLFALCAWVFLGRRQKLETAVKQNHPDQFAALGERVDMLWLRPRLAAPVAKPLFAAAPSLRPLVRRTRLWAGLTLLTLLIYFLDLFAGLVVITLRQRGML